MVHMNLANVVDEQARLCMGAPHHFLLMLSPKNPSQLATGPPSHNAIQTSTPSDHPPFTLDNVDNRYGVSTVPSTLLHLYTTSFPHPTLSDNPHIQPTNFSNKYRQSTVSSTHLNTPHSNATRPQTTFTHSHHPHHNVLHPFHQHLQPPPPSLPYRHPG